MDMLIKNNIKKCSKALIDVGIHTTKIIHAAYESKQVKINDANAFDSISLIEDTSVNFVELARRADIVISGPARKNISVTLPDFMTENRIIQIKNRKESDVGKIIDKEYSNFGRVSPVTHVVDYAFLGKKEEQGDKVGYYLVSAMQKSAANELVSAFAEHKMRITSISCGIYNQYCLSELYFNEYEHLNRLMVDFGTKQTRVTAFSEGVAVYARVIDIGFENYVQKLFETQLHAGKPDICRVLYEIGADTEAVDKKDCFALIDEAEYFKIVCEIEEVLCNEIRRIIDLCANNEIIITKLYYTGFALKGLDKKICDVLGIACEGISFNTCDEKAGNGYELIVEGAELGIRYTNAIAMAIIPLT